MTVADWEKGRRLHLSPVYSTFQRWRGVWAQRLRNATGARCANSVNHYLAAMWQMSTQCHCPSRIGKSVTDADRNSFFVPIPTMRAPSGRKKASSPVPKLVCRLHKQQGFISVVQTHGYNLRLHTTLTKTRQLKKNTSTCLLTCLQ